MYSKKTNIRNTTAFNFFLFLFCFACFCQNALAGDLNLSWDASVSPNVGGYILSYGKSSKNYTSNIDVGKTTTHKLLGLQDGATYFFAVKAYGTTKTIQSAYSNEISTTITAVSTLTASFTASTKTGVAPLVVTFKGAASGTVSGWKWNFGDSSIPTASSQNATVTYKNPGTYSVTLTVTDAKGSVSIVKNNLITVTASSPVANFTSNLTSGNAPLSVAFTDSSTGSITSRLWSFGDGTTSTAINPSHTYNASGSYTVSLKVTGSGGTNTRIRSGYINVSSSASAGSGNIASLSNSLVAAYNFEENGGSIVADASRKGNHGKIRGPVRSAGKFGRGLKFDGVNDIIHIKDSNNLDLSKGFTLEAWVKPLSIKRGTILSKEFSNGAVYNLYAFEDADMPTASFNSYKGSNVITGKAQLKLNTWQHLVATYDGSKFKFYVNGTWVSGKTASGYIRKSLGWLHIGGNTQSGDFFHGYMDEIRIYNRALSLSEILKDYATPIVKLNPTQLVLGNKLLEPVMSSNPKGMAEAFQTTATKTGVMTQINVYLDSSSTATDLIAGVYNDAQGHPGSLIVQQKISNPTSGKTNKILFPAVAMVSGKKYWLAILNTNGVIKFRDRTGQGVGLMETTSSSSLKTLPGKWTTGKVYTDGPMSVFGAGY